MIQISAAAQAHFARLIDAQGGGIVGIRLSAINAGTPAADAKLEFCEEADLDGSEWAVDCTGFTLYLDAQSAPFFEDAEVDYVAQATGGQLSIRAPRIKGEVPDSSAGIVERVQYVIESEINPQVGSHGGRVTLTEITADMVAVLRFGGGCHGCSQVSVTLKNGVEKTLLQRVPELTGVRDATDHSCGSNPYFKV